MIFGKFEEKWKNAKKKKKCRGKIEEKKKGKKIKNRFEVNKLFLSTSLNSLHFFSPLSVYIFENI